MQLSVDSAERLRAILAMAVDRSMKGVRATLERFGVHMDTWVSEHGLRIGVDADPTMISGATRYRLASRVVGAAAGPFEFISRLRPGNLL